jgi:demethylmenaquinone methyltransferase/2-methoxy-6-polyprenyl-1,4-benzoquinol methylase
MERNTTHENSPSNVNAMFTRVAIHYDRLNRLMSLGRENVWRRRAVQLAAVPPGGRLLDVGIGTGAMSLAALELTPALRISGIDPNAQMIQVGRSRESDHFKKNQSASNVAPRPIDWGVGDGLCLPYPAGAFDAVISGFIMRNVSDIAAALAEQRRVVRRGGRVVCLELTRPILPLWRDVYRVTFGKLLPLLTGWLSGEPDAYRYLPASLQRFVSAVELQALMEAAGLRGVGYQTMMLGTVAIHVGIK